MGFIDRLIDNKAKGTFITVKGVGGFFSLRFKKDQTIRILKVYQCVTKNNYRLVESFKLNEDNHLQIKTKLGYFGEVKFLVKWVEQK